MRIEKTGKGLSVLLVEKHRHSMDESRYVRLIQESSTIGDYADSFDRPGSSYLWIGEYHHLNREQVRQLIVYMQRWLNTGELEEQGE